MELKLARNGTFLVRFGGGRLSGIEAFHLTVAVVLQYFRDYNTICTTVECAAFAFPEARFVATSVVGSWFRACENRLPVVQHNAMISLYSSCGTQS